MSALTFTGVGVRTRRLLPHGGDLRAMRRSPRADVTAGITTGVVALPLALAFGVASGVGARAGLVTAIVAGALAAVFGGSRVQVSGPTGAMAVVLLPLVATHGIGAVLLAGMLAGALLITAGYAGVGRYVPFLPLPVVEGFTAGIAVIIALQQVPAALGVTDAGSGRTVAVAARALAHFVIRPAAPALMLTLLVLLVMWAGHRFAHAFPSSLVAVAAATVVAQVTHLSVPRIGHVPAAMPAASFTGLPWDQLPALLPSALAIAALAGIESLLAATVADGLAGGERHDPDRELFGQGVANLVAPLFGGMPATGAVARTAVSVRAGASSRLAALVHSLLLLVVVLALAPAVSRIPVAALAGVLLATAARMADGRALVTLARASRSTGAILAVTLLATVLLDLVRAVELGVAIAAVVALRQVARTARLDRLPADPAGAALTSPHDLIDEHIVVFRIDGSLFFATAHRLLGELLDVADVRVVILRLSGLHVLDPTGARLLADAAAGLRARGVMVLLSGPRDQHRGLLDALGVLDSLGDRGHVFDDVEHALAHGRAHVSAAMV